MNKYQFRAIRNSFIREKVYLQNGSYSISPIMRKKITEVSARHTKFDNDDLEPMYILNKGNNVYKLYSTQGQFTSSFYLITKNDIIIYFTFSSIFSPASDAWKVLTGVFHGYGEGLRNSSWTWQSVDDFDCIDNTYFFRDGRLNMKFGETTHTEYQNEMYKKTGKYYIDKKIVSESEIQKCYENLYYHL